jgi:choline monooxygenase
LKNLTVPFFHRYNSEVERSYNLPGPYYTSPEIFDKEKEKIFSKSWIFAGHIEKVPKRGSYFTVRINDEEIFIIRESDDTIRAFYNVCPHRGHELVKGEGKKNVITCPYHAWTFRLDGQLNKARGTSELKDFNSDEACLSSVRVEVFAKLIFINLFPST